MDLGTVLEDGVGKQYDNCGTEGRGIGPDGRYARKHQREGLSTCQLGAMNKPVR
jgi:hypothetical protein